MTVAEKNLAKVWRGKVERRKGSAAYAMTAPGALLVGLIVVVPTLITLLDSLQTADGIGWANFVTFFSAAPYPQVFRTTLVIATQVTIICTLISVPVAAFVARQPPRRATIILGAVGMSLWISVLVKTYSWQVLLARQGPINELLVATGITSEPVDLLFTRFAVVIAITQAMLPYSVLLLYAGMRQVDRDLIVAAETLGAPTLDVLKKVWWPQVRFSVLSSSLIVWIIATSFFVTPALIGGPGDTMLGQQMQSDLANRFDTNMAQTTGTILTLVLVVVSALVFKFTGRPYARSSREKVT